MKKNRLSYVYDNYKYTLIIESNEKAILIRENNEIKSIINFTKNKTKQSNYILKNENITLDIDITTLVIEIDNNAIKIDYLVNDSNDKFEYYIVRSE